MRVGSARAAAIEWVEQNIATVRGFRGAYLTGSTVGLPDDAELAAASDVDIVVVTAQTEAPMKLGKFRHQGALLEVTYQAWDRVASPEDVLADYHLAGGLRADTIIADPSGQLRAVQAEVSRHFGDLRWVLRRCAHAAERVERGLRSIDPAAPWHHQVTSWLFPTGITTHVLLVAALRNPTVRLRYLAARDVLVTYGRSAVHEELLRLLGCVDLTADRVGVHLAELARTFDAAAAVRSTPFFFGTDISEAARPIAIDGSAALIATGAHREAVFWIVATFARCHAILAADAPAGVAEAHMPAFDAVLADLGITGTADLLDRARHVLDYLPTLHETTAAILAANPGITHPADDPVLP